MMLKKQALILLLSALAWTNIAHALGMGDVELNSSLNQPLNAEIELLQLRGLSAGEILPALASNDAFRRAGVERSFFLSNIRFQIRENEAGSLVIGLTTREPVREPFLNFLVEVNWPGGRLLKEFTLLLDPPVFDTGVVGESLVVDPAAASTGTVTQLTTTTTVSASETQTQVQPAPVERRSDSLGSDQYRVQRNDTLWEIALRLEAGTGFSPQQVMLAIQDLNPDAFISNNINRLKAGTVLNLPDAAQIAIRSLQESVSEVRSQNEGQAARPRAVASETQDVQLTAAETAASALPDGEVDRDPDGYLEVASGEAEGTSAGGDATVPGDVVRLQNELAIAGELADQFEREKQELEGRVAHLEEQINIMQRLLNVQSAEGAALQSEFADQHETQTQPVPVDPEQPSMGEDAVVVVPEPDAPTEAMTPMEPEVQPAPVPAPQPVQPVSDQGFMGFVREFTAPLTHWITASMTNMIIAGAGAIILLLLPSFIRSRMKKDENEDEAESETTLATKSEMTDSDDHHFGDDLLADFDDDEEGIELEVQEADEGSDALMEAEMYMAYQKFEQAEEKLKSALAEQPERVDIGLKLLEVYSETGNSSAFESLVTALTLSTEQQRQVAELRDRLPLLSDADDQDYSMDIGADSDLDFGSEADDTESLLSDDSKTELRAEPGSYDLTDFHEQAATITGSEVSSPSDDLDFSLDIDDLDLSDSGLVDEQPSIKTAESLDELDFNLDDDEFTGSISLTEAKGEDDTEIDGIDFNLDEESDDSDLDFNLDDFETETDTRPVSDPLELDELPETGNAIESEADDGLISFDLGDFEDSSLTDNAKNERETSDKEGLEVPTSQLDSLLTETDTTEEDSFQTLADELPGSAELEDDEFDFLSGSDEASTKLDLARAYIEMDDKEGARDILEEVVAEGSDEQQRQAKELMDQL